MNASYTAMMVALLALVASSLLITATAAQPPVGRVMSTEPVTIVSNGLEITVPAGRNFPVFPGNQFPTATAVEVIESTPASPPALPAVGSPLPVPPRRPVSPVFPWPW